MNTDLIVVNEELTTMGEYNAVVVVDVADMKPNGVNYKPQVEKAATKYVEGKGGRWGLDLTHAPTFVDAEGKEIETDDPVELANRLKSAVKRRYRVKLNKTL